MYDFKFIQSLKKRIENIRNSQRAIKVELPHATGQLNRLLEGMDMLSRLYENIAERESHNKIFKFKEKKQDKQKGKET